MSALVRARGQIMFLVGLILASAVVLWLNRLESVPASDIEPASALVHTPPAQVRASWSWFEANLDEKSGLLRSGQDTGHLLRATLAAHRLGLISGREMYQRLHTTLGTLQHRTASADPALLNALELIAWSYPANSGEALNVLEKIRALRPGGSSGAQTTEAGRHADILVRAAIQGRGEK